MNSQAIDAVSSVSVTYFQWRFYLSLVIAMIMIISSIYLVFFNKDKKIQEVTGIIEDQFCSSTKRGVICNVRVKYSFNDKEYVSDAQLSKISMKGDKISMYIDPLNPQYPTTMKPGTMKMAGKILGAFAVVMVVVSYLIYKATQSNKGFATFMGISQFIPRSF